MKLLHSFLINAICKLKQINDFFFRNNDFSIINTCIEYKYDKSKQVDCIESVFWEKESANWVDESTEYYANLNRFDDITKPPPCVTDSVVRCKFWYNNKVYNFLTYDLEYTWPPKRSLGVKFHIPLSSAQLMDCDDKPVKDILAKIGRYAGPYNDFYKTDVRIKDMFWYSDETIQKLPMIKLKNAFGLTKCVPTASGTLMDLRIP